MSSKTSNYTKEYIKSKWPFDNIEPREVQLEALAAGYSKIGFGYFLRQRLGKTYLAIAEFCMMKEEGKVDWLIIICPNSLKKSWADSIEFADEFLPMHIYDSNRKKACIEFFNYCKQGGVFIINYESVSAFMRDKLYSKINPLRTYLCADESTKIKDQRSTSSKKCLELSSLCQYTRILSGRPMANNHGDLWPQLKFIRATERNYYQFKYTFCIMGGFQGRQVVRNINEEQLKTEMAPYCYIAPDKYIQGFHKIYEPIRRITLTPELQTMYEQMQESMFIELNSGTEITAPIALVKYLRLQQISSGVAGDEDRTQHNLIDPKKNTRIREVIEILEGIESKCIIVCRFRLSIDNLNTILEERGKKCCILKGGMSAKEIEEVKKLFNESDDVNILIAQEQVLSYGHTLPGSDNNYCDTMIFYENSFSLINRAQCEARPEKFGQDIAITYYDIACSDMDEYILESLIKKESASLAIMDYSRKFGMYPEVDAIDELSKELDINETVAETNDDDPMYDIIKDLS